MTAPFSRRRFLGATGVALLATSCRGGGGEVGGEAGEVEAVARLAGLERLWVETYATLRTLAVEGRLGALIPPAVAEFASTATGRHQQHLDAWNRVLLDAGGDEVETADLGLKPRVETAITRLVDIPGLLTLALRIEDHTARTYLEAIPSLAGAEVVRTAAQILVVDRQHQAFLRYLLGLDPVGSGTVPDGSDFAPADPKASLGRW